MKRLDKAYTIGDEDKMHVPYLQNAVMASNATAQKRSRDATWMPGRPQQRILATFPLIYGVRPCVLTPALLPYPPS